MVPTGRRPGTRPKSPKLAAAHEAAEVKITAARATVAARVKQMQAAAHARIAAQRAARSVKRGDTRGTPAAASGRPSLARVVAGTGARKPPPKSTRPRSTLTSRRRG